MVSSLACIDFPNDLHFFGLLFQIYLREVCLARKLNSRKKPLPRSNQDQLIKSCATELSQRGGKWNANARENVNWLKVNFKLFKTWSSWHQVAADNLKVDRLKCWGWGRWGLLSEPKSKFSFNFILWNGCSRHTFLVKGQLSILIFISPGEAFGFSKGFIPAWSSPHCEWLGLGWGRESVAVIFLRQLNWNWNFKEIIPAIPQLLL